MADQFFRVKVTTSGGTVTNQNVKDAVEAGISGSAAVVVGVNVTPEDLRVAGIALRGQTKAELTSLNDKLNDRINRGHRLVAEADSWGA